MTDGNLYRRCASLRITPTESLQFDPIALLSGQDGLVPRTAWEARAVHVSELVPLSTTELCALGKISADTWLPRAQLEAAVGADCLASLCTKGLVVEQCSGGAEGRDSPGARDLRWRNLHWHDSSAIAHASSRWSAIDADAARRQAVPDAVAVMTAQCGLPPPHFHQRVDAIRRVALDEPERTDLDELLEHRATCRNFDRDTALPAVRLSALLKRVFGVHGTEDWVPGAVALKKNHPSGGALHPVEAYLVVQRVDGLMPGLYHYNVEAHALDLLREMTADAARAFAMTAIAGQDYFADAPVLIAMAARFARSMWKYRNHPKIYRAILLEAGHISQNIYLTATEMNLGAFITAAINEVEIEQAFGLEPMAEGPLCVCGFGPRAATKTTVEFDPQGKVWSNR